MQSFDKSKLAPKDFQDLNEAISRAAPMTRFWYNIPGAWKFMINQERIAEETGAVSDFKKLREGHDFMEEKYYNSRTTHISASDYAGPVLGRLVGLKNNDICVYNPRNSLPEIKVGRKSAQLVQIDGLGWGNTYEARVDFERGTADLNEDDQDIAHNLGFIYTPSGVLDVDCLSSSDFESHKGKKRTDESGELILYCDNLGCGKRIRNPVLFVDKQTGGMYHSETCFWKDMNTKLYLSQEVEGLNIEPIPVRIELAEAFDMYRNGELQQSENPRNTYKMRNIKLWPEAALFFPR